MRCTCWCRLVLPIQLHVWQRHMQLLHQLRVWVRANMLWWNGAKPSPSGIWFFKLLHDYIRTWRTQQSRSWPKLWWNCLCATTTNSRNDLGQWSCIFGSDWSMQEKLWWSDDLPGLRRYASWTFNHWNWIFGGLISRWVLSQKCIPTWTSVCLLDNWNCWRTLLWVEWIRGTMQLGFTIFDSKYDLHRRTSWWTTRNEYLRRGWQILLLYWKCWNWSSLDWSLWY